MATSRVWASGDWAPDRSQVRAAPTEARQSRLRRALAGFVQPEGPFLAHLSAAATIACLPVLLAGWAAQDKLVRGLSMGAVK